MLLTNHFKLAVSTIAAIDKERWQIERFLKLLKQQFKIKTSGGTSATAVHTQLWTAADRPADQPHFKTAKRHRNLPMKTHFSLPGAGQSGQK